ncbi:N-acyl-aromatic-L-amino acid amidohydrolase (carboxylate-forming) isoform X2 [Castor canadensis]|nr:N-acyl-aromatic-L-amino acid amidohydrolase (carboxylate-forming) [Castor canadensis]
MYSSPMSQKPLRRVVVTGGTHGNEMSGVYLVQHWLQDPRELQRPSFSAMPVLANPEAVATCCRYIDYDLNRAFTSTILNSKATPDDPYEVRRARELNQLVGPKSSDQAFDFLLDLHNTTANMGACLILESSYSIFTLHLCHYLKLQNPDLSCCVFQYLFSRKESLGLDSVAKNGLTLELGPQPQGVLRADIYSQMRALVISAMDFIELFNQGTAFPAFDMEIYKTLDRVNFPLTEDGALAGTIHPQLQDQDLEPLKPGAPIFKLFNGEDVLYEGDSTVFPLFINEAAYYEKHLAFMKSEKITISVPALSALTSASTLAL